MNNSISFRGDGEPKCAIALLDNGGSTSAGHKGDSPETNLGEKMPQTPRDEFKTKRYLPGCGAGCT